MDGIFDNADPEKLREIWEEAIPRIKSDGIGKVMIFGTGGDVCAKWFEEYAKISDQEGDVFMPTRMVGMVEQRKNHLEGLDEEYPVNFDKKKIDLLMKKLSKR